MSKVFLRLNLFPFFVLKFLAAVRLKLATENWLLITQEFSTKMNVWTHIAESEGYSDFSKLCLGIINALRKVNPCCI